MMKALSTRFGNYKYYGRTVEARNKPTDCFNGEDMGRKGSRFGVRERRKWARMGREEKVRELVRQHGGVNVSTAIRFLGTELEKQKRLLVENLSENLAYSCSCLCHHESSFNNGHDNGPCIVGTGEENLLAAKIADNNYKAEPNLCQDHEQPPEQVKLQQHH